MKWTVNSSASFDIDSGFSKYCGFERDAIRHADRLANAGRLLSSAGDVAVAAFAVYVQINPLSLASELDVPVV